MIFFSNEVALTEMRG